ncbi:cardiolipin synthase [Neobacillus terrae]|uniref:cardiolipin synthase n=1 Tax=Neobacillus terrae TaxID=3034837 RepID=UPI00140A127C|nr:cardiolipin synthase [Neobacillus terrae]NHM30127.1 cardiolipin synthase [Neobacillus terrae]
MAAMLIIGVILLLIAWLIADFRLGRIKNLNNLAKQKEYPILKGRMDLFPHGKELFRDYLGELKNAKKHIHVLFYIVKNDNISMEFFSILKKKASEGVEVRLLLDRLGSFMVKKEMIKDLRKAGVQFSFCNKPSLPYLFYSSQVRNHKKITVIDGETGYLGGFNVGKEYIDEDPKLSPWRDYHIKISGESVPALQEEFLQEWKEYAGINLLSNLEYFPKTSGGEIHHQFIPTETGTLETLYINNIQKAEKTILIGTPYFIPSRKVFNELIHAARRGVSITILVPQKTDHILVREASYRYFRQLLKLGAKIFQYKKGFYHAKTIVIDDTFCDIGTANFDRRSIFLNKEINCMIYDSNFIERVKEVIHQDILDSNPLTLSELNRPNFYRSLKESLAGSISLFL